MQATHPSFRPLNVRTGAASATPVEDHELIEDYALAPVLEVSEEEFDELTDRAPAGSDLTARVAAALAASTRAEANLRALFRTVKFLGASVGAARETNAHLLEELNRLHHALGDDAAGEADEGDCSQVSMELRAILLEQALQGATEQAVREREFLIAEHDSFIASLISDHEQEVASLRQRLAETEAEVAEFEQQGSEANGGDGDVDGDGEDGELEETED